MTSKKAEIFRAKQNELGISYSTFMKYTTGKKTSAVPELRKARNVTDKCTKCTDASKRKAYVEKKLSEMKDEHVKATTQKLMNDCYTSLDFSISRQEHADLKTINDYAKKNITNEAVAFMKSLEAYLTLGKHMFMAKAINAKYYDDMKSLDPNIIVKNSD